MGQSATAPAKDTIRPMLCVQRVSKRFGTVQALSDVSIEFTPGEIHAVLGENGAGKSTLMSILGGFVVPDSGTITNNDRPFPVGNPAGAKRAGVAMVHQHFTLVPAFTVAENLSLAQTDKLAASLEPNRDAEKPLALAKSLGWDLEPSTLVRDLPVGIQQRIEVLKALASDGDILIFDEPTAMLGPEEVEDLFRVLRTLRDRGKTIILIAHKLNEVLAIADRVTVLRKGKWVASAPRSDVDASILMERMVGERVIPNLNVSAKQGGRNALQVQNLHVLGDRRELAVRGVSFEVEAGEILGIGGIDGNGQVELAEVLAGVRAPNGGTITGPEGATAYIPQDRQTDGLALSLSVRDNLLVSGIGRTGLTWGPFLKVRAIREWAEGLVRKFEIKVGRITDPASSLSGGNQQKVVVARNLDVTPKLLIAVNPTRGLDIKATDFVHDQVQTAAGEGSVVTLFSTDRDELEALAGRTVYLSRGELGTSIGGSP